MFLSQTVSDLSSLSEIERDAAERYREAGFDPSSWPTKSLKDLALYQSSGRLWCAYENSAIIGFALVDVYSDSVHLEEIDVIRSMQGKGAGKRLIHAVIQYAKDIGMPCVTLRTFVDTPWSCGLYESCGFLRTSLDYEALSAVIASEIEMGLVLSRRCSYVLELSSIAGLTHS